MLCAVLHFTFLEKIVWLKVIFKMLYFRKISCEIEKTGAKNKHYKRLIIDQSGFFRGGVSEIEENRAELKV